MNNLSIPATLLVITSLVGCNPSGSTSSKDTSSSINMDAPPPSTVEIHDHPSKGPHQGILVELGKDEYHAELVHEDKSVSVYILDSAAKIAVPIEAIEVVINLLHDGDPEQFKLAAAPEVNDPSGKSSRFTSNDAELASHMNDHSAKPKLSVLINGKGYRGIIEHDHHGHKH